MELRHLRYFAAVAEDLNFRKASERLRVAQPALSTQIRDLEDELEVRLFDRDTGGVRLTDAGRSFLAEVKLLLDHAQRAVATAREAAKGHRGQLAVGYIAPLLVGFMPTGLKAFNEKYPGVEVTLVELAISDQMAALEAGTLQVGFTIMGRIEVPAGMQHVEVIRSPIGAIMGRSHRLARAARVSLKDIAREPLLSLMVKRGLSVHSDLLRHLFADRGLPHGPIRSIEGTETFRAMLQSGLGVSLVAQAGSLSRSRDLAYKPLKETGEDLIMELHAVWRQGESSRLAVNFIDMLRAINQPRKKGN